MEIMIKLLEDFDPSTSLECSVKEAFTIKWVYPQESPTETAPTQTPSSDPGGTGCQDASK
jgi:hypothetical protein